MLKLTNLYRKYFDMDELSPILPLEMAAKLQANTMCKEMKVTHEGPNKQKKTLKDRLAFFNFKGVNIGENIAKQQNDDFKEVFKVWIRSKLHKDNILGDYTYSGVATCKGQDKKRYWVLVFGKDMSNNKITKLRNDILNGANQHLQNRSKILSRYFLNEDDPGDPKSCEEEPFKNDDQENKNYKEIYKEDNFTQENLNSNILPEQNPTEQLENFVEKKNDLDLPTEDTQKRPETNLGNNELSKNSSSINSAEANTDNLIFLVKDDQEFQNISSRISKDYDFKYEGIFKKYIALRHNSIPNKETERSSVFSTINSTTSMIPTSTLNSISTLNFGDYLLKFDKTSTKEKSKMQPSTISKSSIPSQYENLLKTILSKLERLENKREIPSTVAINPETRVPRSSTITPQNNLLTIDIRDRPSSTFKKQKPNDSEKSVSSQSLTSVKSIISTFKQPIISTVIKTITFNKTKENTNDKEASLSVDLKTSTKYLTKTVFNYVKKDKLDSRIPDSSSNISKSLTAEKKLDATSSLATKSDGGLDSVNSQNSNSFRTITVTILKENKNKKEEANKEGSFDTSVSPNELEYKEKEFNGKKYDNIIKMLDDSECGGVKKEQPKKVNDDKHLNNYLSELLADKRIHLHLVQDRDFKKKEEDKNEIDIGDPIFENL